MIIWVFSSVVNFDRRQLIRETWGNAQQYNQLKVPIRVIFSLGLVQDDKVQEMIEMEQRNNGDIVQDEEFIDHVQNNTYKVSPKMWLDSDAFAMAKYPFDSSFNDKSESGP